MFPMKILLYSANFAPEPVGIGKYSGEMVNWLIANGHEVRVVAAPPYYPNWRVDAGYRWPFYRRQRLGGALVWRSPLWVPQSPGGLKRILHLVSFAITSLPVILLQALWRPHVVMTVAPAFVCAPAGWLTARLCGAKAWLHIQDFEVDVAFQLGMLKSKRLRQFIRTAEHWMLRQFDSVSSISHRMVERLMTKGVSAERTLFFPNWVDTAKVGPFCSGTAYRRELGIDRSVTVVLFSGTLSAKQGLWMIPRIAQALSERSDILLMICGDGAMKPQLEESTRDLANVRLLPLQPVERLGELLAMADIHLLPQNSEAADLVLPSKLAGMLASGRPVVASCAPGTELASVVSHCGLTATTDDPEALAAAILQLADQPEMRAELGRHARDWAELHLEREVVLARAFASLNGDSLESQEDNVQTEDGVAVSEEPVAVPE
jgi:colanic acid biosynthesis glycosyl transferase WcaI